MWIRWSIYRLQDRRDLVGPLQQRSPWALLFCSLILPGHLAQDFQVNNAPLIRIIVIY